LATTTEGTCISIFCTGCGKPNTETSRFCASCGNTLARAVTPPLAVGDSRSSAIAHNEKLWGPRDAFYNRRLSPRGIVLVLAGGLTVIAGLIALGVATEQPTPASVVAPATTTKPQAPRLANVTLHAYDLLKNPYGYQNQIVFLNVIERPVMYNNSVIQYADIGGTDPRVATKLGLTGVRLNRMLSENVALYDILGLNANYNSDSQVLGQLVVVLPIDRTDLELSRYWEVEPLGVIDGTNSFGAQIQVPHVRFWRYKDEGHQQGSAAQR
jgi:hypothetical protein